MAQGRAARQGGREASARRGRKAGEGKRKSKRARKGRKRGKKGCGDNGMREGVLPNVGGKGQAKMDTPNRRQMPKVR